MEIMLRIERRAEVQRHLSDFAWVELTGLVDGNRTVGGFQHRPHFVRRVDVRQHLGGDAVRRIAGILQILISRSIGVVLEKVMLYLVAKLFASADKIGCA